MDRNAVAAVAALDDPVRAALYRHARAAESPVTREEAAAAVGISRKLAAFHMDKLVACGLLEPAPAGTPRRVGRAPKRYRPTGGVSVQVPPREHDLLAGILIEAVLASPAGESAPVAVLRVARERGAALGAAERERSRPGRLGPERALALSEDVLARHGYEPARSEGCVRLSNCTFHPLAAKAPDLVCHLNQEFVTGILAGLHADSAADAVLAPHAGECCVQIRARQRP